MAAGAPVYNVDDRSILLPFYRRLLVDPALPYLPAALHPNTITHAGHVANLTGTATLLFLWPASGWPFAFAAVLLQVYLWCDNADGAHARRTGQCSAFGEFLDHGLDVLNVTYISLLTAMSLGAPPLWWVAIALLIPGAGAITYWEQAQTGVFRLGLLNQVESLSVLTLTLLVRALFGAQVFERIALGPVTLQLAFLIWLSSTILFGMLRAVVRVVATDGVFAVAPALGLLAFGAATAAAVALGAISSVAGVILATAGNVYTSMHMLSSRARSRKPRLATPTAAAAVLLGALIALRLLDRPVGPTAGPALALLACAVFGVSALVDARAGTQEIARAEPDRVAALK